MAISKDPKNALSLRKGVFLWNSALKSYIYGYGMNNCLGKESAMLMSKCFKICVILTIIVLWACSDDESPTSINAGQSQLESKDISLSQDVEFTLSSSSDAIDSGTSIAESSDGSSSSADGNEHGQSGETEFIFSSSSSSVELETPIAESSSATVEIVKKSKFVLVEHQQFVNNSKGELYLSNEMICSDYKILSDSSMTYQITQTMYNEEDSVISRGASLVETEYSMDKDINYVTYAYQKTTSMADGKQVGTSPTQTMTKEFVGETEKGREYILHNTYNGVESGGMLRVYVDSDGFITEMSSYSSDSLISTTLYTRLPNAPESISKSMVCGKPLVDENSVYEYYNLSCEDVVNTADEYKLVVKYSYKIKSVDKEYNQETHLTYKRFEY